MDYKGSIKKKETEGWGTHLVGNVPHEYPPPETGGWRLALLLQPPALHACLKAGPGGGEEGGLAAGVILVIRGGQLQPRTAEGVEADVGLGDPGLKQPALPWGRRTAEPLAQGLHEKGEVRSDFHRYNQSIL